MNAIGQRLAALIAAVKGNDAVSPLMVNLNFGSYCKRIPDAASPNAWLSRDTQVVRDYDADQALHLLVHRGHLPGDAGHPQPRQPQKLG